MEIKLRKFEFGDLPKLSKILKKMDLKDTMKSLFATPDAKGKKKEDIEKLQEEMGADLAATAIVNLWMAENEVYELIAGVADKTVEEVKKMDIDDMMKLFTEFGKNAASVISFFRSAAK